MSLSALQQCVRAVRQLTVENPRHTFAKPVRVSVIYQVSSLCVKACILLMRHVSAGESTGVEAPLVLVEECMGMLLPRGGPAQQAMDSAEPLPAEERVWSALLASWAGLKECRRLDAFDFRSVYRVADTISTLAALVSAGVVPVPPQWVADRLKGLGVREPGAAAALEELARLFDRKRSQIVAMWCVENAVSPWEKV